MSEHPLKWGTRVMVRAISDRWAIQEPDVRTREHAGALLEIHQSLSSRFGDATEPERKWIREESHHLEDVPGKLVQTEEGALKVRDFLRLIDGR